MPTKRRPSARQSQAPISPGDRTADSASRKEIGKYVETLDTATNRAGIVPAGGHPDSAVDPRRRLYLGKQRLGKRWSEILIAVNDGVFTWEEFVETLDASEIARGQLKDKRGNFTGRPPQLVPRGFFDACQKVLLKRARQEYEKAYLLAIETMTSLATGKDADGNEILGVKPEAKMKAAQFVIERMEGKTPEKVEVKVSNPFQDMVAGVIAEVAEDAAIANAQDYYNRIESQGEDRA